MKNSTLKNNIHSFLVRTQNSLNGPLEDKIIFYHIPKCGGTSIRKTLKSCYLTWDRKASSRLFILKAGASFQAAQKISDKDLSSDTADDYSILKLRENLLLYHMCQKNIDFISGHFVFSEAAYQHFNDVYASITILRDPVERWISSYFFNTFKEDEHRKIDMDIEDYLRSDLAKSQGYEYVKFLGGLREDSDYGSSQAIARAKANLQKFSLVGFLEHADIFVRRFEQKFNKPLKIETLNKSPKQADFRDSILTVGVREKIQEICQPDIEIYQYAIANYLENS